MSTDEHWKVSFSKKANKQLKKISQKYKDMVFSLKVALEKVGPIQKEWPNFSGLDKKKERYHCHLNRKGHPTYVVVWDVIDHKIRLIEINYVGTREGAPY